MTAGARLAGWKPAMTNRMHPQGANRLVMMRLRHMEPRPGGPIYALLLFFIWTSSRCQCILSMTDLNARIVGWLYRGLGTV